MVNFHWVPNKVIRAGKPITFCIQHSYWYIAFPFHMRRKFDVCNIHMSYNFSSIFIMSYDKKLKLVIRKITFREKSDEVISAFSTHIFSKLPVVINLKR